MGNLGTTTVQVQSQTQVQSTNLEVEKSIFEQRAKKSGSWFYWIAGLSLLNSLIMVSGSDWHFLVGLGITEVFDVVGRRLGGPGSAVALVFGIGIAGTFAMFGYFASTMRLWAFVAGMILYALDGILLFSFSDYFSVAFHGLALYYLFLGMVATRKWSLLKPANAPLG